MLPLHHWLPKKYRKARRAILDSRDSFVLTVSFVRNLIISVINRGRKIKAFVKCKLGHLFLWLEAQHSLCIVLKGSKLPRLSKIAPLRYVSYFIACTTLSYFYIIFSPK